MIEESPDMTALSVRNLRTWFPTPHGVVRSVDGVSLAVGRGKTLGVVGESGSGKSVLCRTVMNLLPRTAIVPDETEVLFEGRNIRQLDKKERKHFWGVEVAMVFQDPMTSLNPVMRVGEQVAGPLRYHLGLSRQAARERTAELLTMVGVPAARERARQYPHELSGGMRQRITIARALACEPKLLIADEPTTALDVTVQRQVLDLLQRLQQTRHMTMILVTHDLGVVAGRADDVVVMYGGQVVEQGPTKSLFSRPQHPYTEGLLASIPRMRNRSHTRLRAIPGRPPVVIGESTQCAFAPRCERAQPRCLSEPPPLTAGDGSAHRCFFPAGANGGA